MTQPEDRKKERENESYQVSEANNWIQQFFQQFPLAWRLLLDNRIPLATKLIPIFSTIYIISPADLVPGLMIPGLGQLDDLAILIIGLRLFIDVCPPELVREHQQALHSEKRRESWNPPGQGPIIDLDAEIIEEEEE